MKNYIDGVLNQTGYYIEMNVDKEARRENELYRESSREYQDIIQEATDTNKDLRLYARSAALLDADNNRVLYEENGDSKVAMASTTKIMTCIIALEFGNPEDVVTVSQYASTMPDVQLNIKKGQQFYLKDLLYSLMLESHNDVAVAVAEHVGGSVEGFAKLMNAKALELGCKDTSFVTPNGLDANEHYTTAKDLAVIASYAIKNEEFIRITNQDTWSFKEITKGTTYQVSNKNRFLYMMDGAIGVKTGFTNMAGYCFVGGLKKEDKTFVSVVLGSGWPPNKNYKWTDTKQLMNYGLSNYHFRQIFEDITMKPLPVERGTLKYVQLNYEGDIGLLLRDDEKVTIKYDLPEVLTAPITKDEVIGEANYYIDDTLYQTLYIFAKNDVEEINFNYCFQTILRLWLMQEETVSSTLD